MTVQNPPRLIDIPADKFPLPWGQYNRLHNELIDISGEFMELAYSGHADGKHLSNLTSDIVAALEGLWEAILEVEQRERKAEIITG